MPCSTTRSSPEVVHGSCPWPGDAAGRGVRGRARPRGRGPAARPAHPPGGGAAGRRGADRPRGARLGRPAGHRPAGQRRARVPVPAGRLRARPQAVPGAARAAGHRGLAGHRRAGRGHGRGPGRGRVRAGVRAGGPRADHHRPGHAAAHPARQRHAGRPLRPLPAGRRGGGGAVPGLRHRPVPRGQQQVRGPGVAGRGRRPGPGPELRAAAGAGQPAGADPPGGRGLHRPDDHPLDRRAAAAPAA